MQRYPWSWCNLRGNPFGELTLRQRQQLACVDFDDWISRLSKELDGFPQPRQAWQWIAPCGFGKSTHLYAASEHFANSHYVYVTPERTCDVIPEAELLLIDEVDRLPRKTLHAVLNSGVALMLGTHRCLAKPMRRFGYRVWTNHLAQSNNAKRLCDVLNRRLQFVRLKPDAPIPEVSQEEAELLFQRFGGNFRAVEHHLYEFVQRQHSEDPDGRLQFIDRTG